MPSPKRLRVTGIPGGSVDTQEHEILFDLLVVGNQTLSFVAKYGVAAQLIGALGHMLKQLQAIVIASGGHQTAAVEEIHMSFVQKDKWSDRVIVQLTTPVGVPYTFAMPARVAADIAEQLKTESEKPTEVGTA